jgi:Lon protease-like protein
MSAFGFRKPDDLPRIIPVFPLAGALLLPRSNLPLNIFEPRYLNMIDDALASDRLIGMIQPDPHGGDPAQPILRAVGCAGRITNYAETEDGRYLITLTGVCRFRPARELPASTPYRQVNALYDDFARDLLEDGASGDIDRARLGASLRRYVDANGFNADWGAVDDAPAEALINALATLCPFDPEEKQALLEARDLPERCAALIALLEIAGAGGAPSAVQ